MIMDDGLPGSRDGKPQLLLLPNGWSGNRRCVLWSSRSPIAPCRHPACLTDNVQALFGV
jgi:hypothetical protein